MDKELLKYINEQLYYAKNRMNEAYNTLTALEKTVEHFSSEDEEPTIEDEIMSCLKDFINDNDSFKNVKIKVVKVDEDDD